MYAHHHHSVNEDFRAADKHSLRFLLFSGSLFYRHLLIKQQALVVIQLSPILMAKSPDVLETTE